MRISGLVAGGMQDALQDMQDRRYREAQAHAEAQARAQQLAIQQAMQQAAQERGQRQDALDQRRFDLESLRYRGEQAAAQTDRNVGLDASNVMGMPGMTDEARARELTQSVLRNPRSGSATAMLKMIEGLTKIAPEKKYGPPQRLRDGTLGQFEEGRIPAGTQFYQAPRTAPTRTYEWVTGADGTPRRIRTDDPGLPGDTYFDKAAGKDTDAKAEALDTVQETYRLSNELVNAKGFEGAFGLASSRMPTLKGDTADAELIRDSLMALLTVENMKKMKGVLSDSDMRIVQRASTTIHQRMSPAAARKELTRVMNAMAGAAGFVMPLDEEDLDPDDTGDFVQGPDGVWRLKKKG